MMTKTLWRNQVNVLRRLPQALLLPVLAIGLLAGCANLPDVQPFSDATLQLRSAVASSGAAVVGELQRVEIPGADSHAVELEQTWAARNRLFDSMVEYAISLQGIVDAGRTGADAAAALADSAARLAAAANIMTPGASEAAALATDTARFIYEHIAVARAASSLEKALAEVQPAVQRIAQVMSDDVEDLDALLRVATQAQKNALEEQFQRETSYRDQLIRSRQSLYAALQQKLTEGQNPSSLAEAAELRAIDGLLAAAEEACEPFDAQLAAIGDREQLGRRLLTEIDSGLASWAAAHARILSAVRSRRTPNAIELTLAAQRIQDLVERYEAL